MHGSNLVKNKQFKSDIQKREKLGYHDSLCNKTYKKKKNKVKILKILA